DPGTGVDHDGGFALLDDRRPLELGAGAQRVAVVDGDLRVSPPVGEVHAAHVLPRSAWIPAHAGGRREAETRPGALGDDAPRDRFDRRIPDGMAVDRAVRGLEAPVDLVAPRRAERPVGNWHTDLV